MKKIIALLFVLTLASGCTMAQQHRAAVTDESADRVSIAAVQRDIKNGMSSAEVVEVLGAPNLVTVDKQRRETWVYDKIATLTVYSFSGVNAEAKAYAGTSHKNWDGAIGGGAGGEIGAGAQTTVERTLTIVIKFDNKGLVRDYAYRQTSF